MPAQHEDPSSRSGFGRSTSAPPSTLAAASAAASGPSSSSKDYYTSGCTDLAQPTATTLKKLQKRRELTANSERLVIVLVGLPGRGKSFVARKLSNYLTWRGSECKIFNVGKYRREAAAEAAKREKAERKKRREEERQRRLESGGGNDDDTAASSDDDEMRRKEENGACGADFFDSKNEAAARLREEVAALAMRHMLSWLDREEEDRSGPGGGSKGGHNNASPPSPESTPTTTPSTSPNPYGNYGPGVGGGKGRPKVAVPCGNGMRSSSVNSLASEHSCASSVGSTTTSSLNRRNERVAIYDATNSTNSRREWILAQCAARPGSKTAGVVFVESLCDDEELLEENFRFKIQNSPDFRGMTEAEAIADLKKRVTKYEEQYETIEDDSLSYIKIFNLSSKLMVNHIYGRMAKVIVPCLMSWNIGSRPVFITRAGETLSLQQQTQGQHGFGGLAAGTASVVGGVGVGGAMGGNAIAIPRNNSFPTPASFMSASALPPPSRPMPSHIPPDLRASGVLHVGGRIVVPPPTPSTPKLLHTPPSPSCFLPTPQYHQQQHQPPYHFSPMPPSPAAAAVSAKLSRGSRLAPLGLKFRDALCDYIRAEGLGFIRRQKNASRDLCTGTSVNGLKNQCAGWKKDGKGAGRKSGVSEEGMTIGAEPPLDAVTSTGDGGGSAKEDEKKDDDARRFPSACCDDFLEEEEDNDDDDDYKTYPDEDGRFPFPCHIMSSTMPRAVETAKWERLPYHVEELSNLNPLDKGDFTGLELEEIAAIAPDWYAQLEADPFRTRFPGGECYGDLINRLEPTIIDMEQQVGLAVVVSHVSVIQALVAYFRSTPVHECTSIEVPLHTVIKFTPSRGGGWVESRHKLISDEEEKTGATSEVTGTNVPMPIGEACRAGQSSAECTAAATETPPSGPAKAQEIPASSNALERSPVPIWGDHFKLLSRKNSFQRDVVVQNNLSAPILE